MDLSTWRCPDCGRSVAVRLSTCPRCGHDRTTGRGGHRTDTPPSARQPRRQDLGAPAPGVRDPRDRERARDLLWQLFAWGVGLALFAAVTLGLALHDSDAADARSTSGGELLGLVLGGLAAAGGWTVLAVAVVAAGVKIGREAADA